MTEKEFILVFLVQSEKEESFASKKSSSFRFEIISPHSSSGPRSDDKNLRYIYDESRSPRYTQKYSRNAGLTKSPIKIEVVDDRFQDDERRNRRLSNIASKLKQISIDGQKNVDKSQLPVERPLGEILRENASSLQVGEPPILKPKSFTYHYQILLDILFSHQLLSYSEILESRNLLHSLSSR